MFFFFFNEKHVFLSWLIVLTRKALQIFWFILYAIFTHTEDPQSCCIHLFTQVGIMDVAFFTVTCTRFFLFFFSYSFPFWSVMPYRHLQTAVMICNGNLIISHYMLLGGKKHNFSKTVANDSREMRNYSSMMQVTSPYLNISRHFFFCHQWWMLWMFTVCQRGTGGSLSCCVISGAKRWWNSVVFVSSWSTIPVFSL